MWIDETAGGKTYGRSFSGTPARMPGHPTHGSQQWTVLVAVDSSVGVVARVLYKGATTKERFLVFLTLAVFPAIADTGSRIITFDNLNCHLLPDVRSAILYEGHRLVLRPKHSPDFGGVEWVFSFVHKALVHFDKHVTNDNFEAILNNCLDYVTPELVAKYMACAHFYVPPHEFRPYMGQQ